MFVDFVSVIIKCFGSILHWCMVTQSWELEYLSLGLGYLCLRHGYLSLRLDYLCLGHNYLSLELDYLCLGHG
jgi:hypothetical protein